MTSQVSAGSITDAEFLDQSGIAHSAALQIVCSLRMTVQLKLIKSGRLLQQSENGSGGQFLFEMSHRLAEG